MDTLNPKAVPTYPQIRDAATAIVACAGFYPDSPEPYRAAAYGLGWGPLDGTEFWAAIMDTIG